MPLDTSAPAAKQSTQTHCSSITYLSSDKTEKVVALFAQQVAFDMKAAGYSQLVEMPVVTKKLLTRSRSSVVEMCKNIAGPDGLRVFCGRGEYAKNLSGNRIMRAVVQQISHEFQIKAMPPRVGKRVCISTLADSLTSLGMTFHHDINTPLEPSLSKEGVIKKMMQLVRDTPHQKNDTVSSAAERTTGPLPRSLSSTAQIAEPISPYVPSLYELDDSDISLFSFDFDDQSLMKEAARQN